MDDRPEDFNHNEDRIPTKMLVDAFLEAVKKHNSGDDAPDSHIAVFGAKGYNTAGYLIVRYMNNTYQVYCLHQMTRTQSTCIIHVP
jgi:hypothetical protein